MKKISLMNAMIIVSLVMFILGFFVPIFLDKPQEMHEMSPHERSIRIYGLSPKTYRLLSHSTTLLFLCIAATFFYSRKIAKSLVCENDVLRLRQGWRFYHYLLLTAGILSFAKIILVCTGLLSIQHIQSAHLFHSKLFSGMGQIFICITFFLLTRKYIKYIQTTSPSILLRATQDN